MGPHGAWTEPGGPAGNLFTHGDRRLPVPDRDAAQPRVSRRFMEIAKTVIMHSDPERFGLLYRVLWRLQSKPRLIEDAADGDIRAMADMARAVRRDIHKMRAFLRFREVEHEEGEYFVAWFEPFHHILRHNAGFFTRRFANMRWSILTPQGSLHWDTETMREGPPADRADAPGGAPCRRGPRDLPGPERGASVRARGLRPRGVPARLALAARWMWPSASPHSVGTPELS